MHDVNEALEAFNEGYLGGRNGGLSGAESVGFGALNVGSDYLLGKASERLSKESFDEEDIARAFMEEPMNEVVKNFEIPGSSKWFDQYRDEIEKRKKQYMKEMYIPERKAWWKATKELLEESM